MFDFLSQRQMLHTLSSSPVLAWNRSWISLSCDSAGMSASVATSRSAVHREITAFAGGPGRTPAIDSTPPVSLNSCTIWCAADTDTSKCSEIFSYVSSSKKCL